MSLTDDVINEIKAQIEATKQRIAELEAELETLKAFKTDVSDSQDSFSTVNEAKKQYISDLYDEVKDNECVNTLARGMSVTLDSVGYTCVKGVYLALLGSIDFKILEYETKIMNEKASLWGLIARLSE
ncbi:MAG: hypothetical protein E7272_11380 [Pseudobutyrivibrio ruminis]|uniref:Uncharacterized protein n=1 Tax=Pseudobutyrivibrio ruminis TaxID=46206 RepID=A0A927UCK4_9FIRM|nr:hypothetical protein [Pseudobutyrivibrio sp.]MBE5920428.1 hypothetical protein [Pseudobutyrivibrio ruminis]MBQ6462838.1 hypothetical protein [Pseudobutyrivibrio sp.]